MLEVGHRSRDCSRSRMALDQLVLSHTGLCTAHGSGLVCFAVIACAGSAMRGPFRTAATFLATVLAGCNSTTDQQATTPVQVTTATPQHTAVTPEQLAPPGVRIVNVPLEPSVPPRPAVTSRTSPTPPQSYDPLPSPTLRREPADKQTQPNTSQRHQPEVVAPKAVSDAEIVQAIIAQSRARYPGNCGCPDDRDRAGRRCGGRSAYSKAGGYSVLCYERDVTPAMIQQFRNRG